MVGSTSMRVSEATLQAMRLAASEIAIARNQWIESDDQRLLTLVEYWDATKDAYIANEQVKKVNHIYIAEETEAEPVANN